MKRAVIIGASGFIGKRLKAYLEARDVIVLGTYSSHQESDDLIHLDLLDDQGLKKFVKNLNPGDHIFWIAGNKDVKSCEQEPKAAFEINSHALSKFLSLIEIESIKNLKLTYLSTDYVFEGKAGNYTENCECHPSTVYGQSKLLGEKYCLEYPQVCHVVRTGAVMGRGGLFFGFLTSNLEKAEPFSLFNNLYFSPTPINLLCESLLQIFKGEISPGLISHCTGGRRMSRFEFGSFVKDLAPERFKAELISESLAPEKVPLLADTSLLTTSCYSDLVSDSLINSYFLNEVESV